MRETDYDPVLRDRCRRGSEKKGKRESDWIFRVFPFSSSSSSSFLVIIVVVVIIIIIIIIIIIYNIIVFMTLNTSSRWLAVVFLSDIISDDLQGSTSLRLCEGFKSEPAIQ